ncbi:hypothetical protein FPV67DRAFT_1650013 [Lyophyllum atratum]|nr:hypothetical protein FPV67DRAFT_1650013 [Lyophyllum atratum]
MRRPNLHKPHPQRPISNRVSASVSITAGTLNDARSARSNSFPSEDIFAGVGAAAALRGDVRMALTATSPSRRSDIQTYTLALYCSVDDVTDRSDVLVLSGRQKNGRPYRNNNTPIIRSKALDQGVYIFMDSRAYGSYRAVRPPPMPRFPSPNLPEPGIVKGRNHLPLPWAVYRPLRLFLCLTKASLPCHLIYPPTGTKGYITMAVGMMYQCHSSESKEVLFRFCCRIRHVDEPSTHSSESLTSVVDMDRDRIWAQITASGLIASSPSVDMKRFEIRPAFGLSWIGVGLPFIARRDEFAWEFLEVNVRQAMDPSSINAKRAVFAPDSIGGEAGTSLDLGYATWSRDLPSIC